MTQQQQMAQNVPHAYRKKVLLTWLPVATADMANEAMLNLFNAWFVFIDPAGVQKPNCPVCVRNILENWQGLAGALAEEERNYNALQKL